MHGSVGGPHLSRRREPRAAWIHNVDILLPFAVLTIPCDMFFFFSFSVHFRLFILLILLYFGLFIDIYNVHTISNIQSILLNIGYKTSVT